MSPNRRMVPLRERPEWKAFLVAIAKQSTRMVDGRLANFAYAPPPSVDDRREIRQVSDEVRSRGAAIVWVARLEALSNDAESRAAFGVASLLVDERESAVRELEKAVRLQANNPLFLNDLSAALLALAQLTSRPDDFSRARTAAERAMRIAPDLNEPYFNHALALEGLHLESQSAAAWRVVAAREPGSPWGKEAESHLMARPTGSKPEGRVNLPTPP
jgi:tetratricopeptide (TPR) repeat protein